MCIKLSLKSKAGVEPYYQLDEEKDVLNIRKDGVKNAINTTATTMGHNLEQQNLSLAHPLPVLYHKYILNKLRTWLNFLKSLDYSCLHNGGNRKYIC